jgi:hypothetical protein
METCMVTLTEAAQAQMLHETAATATLAATATISMCSSYVQLLILHCLFGTNNLF